MADLQGQMITLEVPGPNKGGLKLAEDFNMKFWHSTARMYTAEKYHQDTRYIYSNTTRIVG